MLAQSHLWESIRTLPRPCISPKSFRGGGAHSPPDMLGSALPPSRKSAPPQFALGPVHLWRCFLGGSEPPHLDGICHYDQSRSNFPGRFCRGVFGLLRCANGERRKLPGSIATQVISKSLSGGHRLADNAPTKMGFV
jgi:hypothetical protein